MLLTALFHLIAEFPKASALLEKRKKKVLLLQEVQIRLNQTLNKYFDQYPFFYDEKHQKIYFTYDNGIDMDPSFGAAVHGSLGLNKNHFLILETTSILDPSQTRKEVLLKEVKNLSVFFFCPKKKKWKSSWPKKEAGFPSMLRISFDHQGERYMFSVIFPQKEPIALS